MKKFALALGGLACLFASCEEDAPSPLFEVGMTIVSVVNDAIYDLRISRPADYSTSGEKYAVIYVLDGEENFNLVTSESKKLSARYGGPNVLVVSIGYGNDRNLDYTPTKTNGITGGAPLFLKFLKEELIPRMEKEFSADTARSSRVILGHSYGGLFGAYAFGANNSIFGNYILLSPSLWYDNEVALRLERGSRNSIEDRCQLVFLGGGEMENSGRMQVPVDGFYNALKDNYRNAHVGRNIEKDLDHVGSKNPNILKGLDFYFQNR